MTAYNPITTVAELEASGFKRNQAEALASALHGATTSVVTREELDRALAAQSDKLTVRIGAMVAALLAVAVTVSNFI